MEPETPRMGKCEKHGLQVAPDGLCTLCRRANAPQAGVSDTGNRLVTTMLGLVAVVVVAGGLFFALRPTPSADASFKPHGPPLHDQIAAVDKQLKELRHAQAMGELGGGGLDAISALEHKRSVLMAQQDTQERNSR